MRSQETPWSGPRPRKPRGRDPRSEYGPLAVLVSPHADEHDVGLVAGKGALEGSHQDPPGSNLGPAPRRSWRFVEHAGLVESPERGTVSGIAQRLVLEILDAVDVRDAQPGGIETAEARDVGNDRREPAADGRRPRGMIVNLPRLLPVTAAVALMLARDEAKNFTGCLFPVDGGTSFERAGPPG